MILDSLIAYCLVMTSVLRSPSNPKPEKRTRTVKKRFGVYILLLSAGLLSACPTPSTNNEQTNADAGMTERTPPPELPPPENPIGKQDQPELIDDGFVFTEGPLWDAKNKIVYFSDLIGNTLYKMTLDDPIDIQKVRGETQLGNGLALDAKGRIVTCERITRRLSVMEADGTVNTLVDKYEGKLLNGPNDITVHSDGAIYFTDPPYALSDDKKELDFNGVFRLAPDGKTLTALWKGEAKTLPNGIILSPYDQKLYFADAANDVIWVGTLKADGGIETPKKFVDTGEGPDGLAMDANGNLYVATKAGVEVYSREGQKWGVITIPKHPANMTFIGEDRKTLLVAARSALYQIKNMPIAGVH